jgi:membrane protein
MIVGLRGALSRFRAADGPFLAAGLAFFFLLCLLPLVLLGVSLLGFVLSREQATLEVVAQIARNFPVYRREVSAALVRIIELRALSGLLGTVILIGFSTPLLSAARLVMHRLLGVKDRGNFVRNMTVDGALVLVLSALVFAATAVTWTFDWFREVVLNQVAVSRLWVESASVGLSLALSGTMFFLAYRHLPRRRVRVGPALGGAVLATLLWEIAKRLFGMYIRRIGFYHLVYGPLGALVAFAMVIYYAAFVFVLGAAYVAALEGGAREGRR